MIEIEQCNFEFCWQSLVQIVPLPVPEGPEITIKAPFFISLSQVATCYTREPLSSCTGSRFCKRCLTVSGCTAERITCPLSVIITARVLRPYVASTNMPLSLASPIIRLIGADSGLTMAMIRFAETIFPKPILISLISF